MRPARALLYAAFAALVSCSVVNGFDEVKERVETPAPCPEPCRHLAPQCGCPGGQMCDLVGVNLECVLEGTDPPYGPCSTASCVPGYHCIRAGTVSQCLPFCETDEDCDGTAICAANILAPDDTPLPYMVCSVECNLFTGAGCQPDSKCFAALDAMEGRWFTICSPIGPGVQGDPCSSTYECAAGFHCVSVTGDIEQCTQYCDPDAPACGTGTHCANLSEPLIVAGDLVGVCVPD